MTKAIHVKNLILGEGIPKICVPLTGTTKEALIKEAEEAVKAGAELVEWRADFFEGLKSPEKNMEMLRELFDTVGQIPLIFTIRTHEEGGNCQINTKDYVNLCLGAARSGMADFIDVQVFGDEAQKQALVEEIHRAGCRVIASSHDFEKTDDRETLLRRFQEMDKTGADILKMAVMPEEFENVAAIMQATAQMRDHYTEKPLVSMAMGSKGSISRISGENFGSCITFGTVGKASAPGQFPVEDLRIMMEALHRKNQE